MYERETAYDAVIVGSGPNGLAAAIELARNNLKVVVLEARDTIGGGMRSADLNNQGVTHDICSAVHPLAIASPFFKHLPLEQYGFEWIQPRVAVAHPFDDQEPATLSPGLKVGVEGLGADAAAWRDLLAPFVRKSERLFKDILGPLGLPHHPFLQAKFGRIAMTAAKAFAENHFRGAPARALFAGLAGHSMLPLDKKLTSAIGLVLAVTAHSGGWPMPKGGSQKLADALAQHLGTLGGEIVVNHEVRSIKDLPSARAILCDTSPHFIHHLAGEKLPKKYRRKLRKYRYGVGAFKIDWVLEGPVPFTSDRCRKAGTVHLGGLLEEIVHAERTIWRGNHPERPFVLLAQPSNFDKTRAPEGKHAVWAYCHVPRGSIFDMTERIEHQVERFAPGFKDRIVARHTITPREFEQYNPNYVGGDINGGVQDFKQLFARPVLRPSPYSTPIKGLYLCSSSTPPGGGVHGMCGYHAARRVLRDRF